MKGSAETIHFCGKQRQITANSTVDSQLKAVLFKMFNISLFIC